MDLEEESTQPLFLCPKARFRYKDGFHEIDGESCQIIDSSFSFHKSGVRRSHLSHPHHYVLPLLWCNNKLGELDDVPFCSACSCRTIGTDYYRCLVSNSIYHKECVESPSKINHPLHSKHPLQLIYFTYRTSKICYCCGQSFSHLIYYCSVCDFSLYSICAQKPLRLNIDHPKRHAHTLTLFPRQGPLTCSTCGLDHFKCSFYICAPCDFVVHVDCINLPWVIRISRHRHRLSYTFSLPSGEWSCGVCRQRIDEFCGEYSCNKGCAYAVHSKCATREDIWDGKELEGIPEEFDQVEDDRPLFEKIDDKTIRHFGHEHHHLRLDDEVNRVYNEKKICQACIVPIYGGSIYSCLKCDFVLHEVCANLPRKKQHPLHRHPLTLLVDNKFCDDGYYHCRACLREFGGFSYRCCEGKCYFDLDVRCALVLEPFHYQGHPHPLYLIPSSDKKATCSICFLKRWKVEVLRCIVCDFTLCFECATFPYTVRYKHHGHLLTFSSGKVKQSEDVDWCEICERRITDANHMCYVCNVCCVTVHVECMFGKDPYMKPGQSIIWKDEIGDTPVDILPNYSQTRLICKRCIHRCRFKIVFKASDSKTYCSTTCLEFPSPLF